MESYSQAFSQSFPLNAFPPNNIKFNKPWYDDELHQLMLNKDKLFKKFISKKSPTLKAKYNMAQNVYFHALQAKKSNYHALLFEKNKFNMKATWKTINKLLGKGKVASCSSLVVDSQLTSDSLAIANYFNNHFASIASKLVDNLLPSLHNFREYLGTSSADSMYLNPTSLLEIKNILLELKSTSSSGIDEIPSSVLKSTPDNILQALAHIFNLSLSRGEYISAFKIAKIVPVFKKGNPTEVNNYRPISLLPVMSKVLEKIMHRRVTSFLTQQNFFFKLQFGFRKNHSTSLANTLLTEYIVEAFENRKKVLGVFLDLSKAFDTIDHNILLHKLKHCGIRGLANDWFQSYLSGRTQMVEQQNACSQVKSIQFGVPQGSILGPLLFLIYVNDFHNCIAAGDMIMFADDTNIFFTGRNYETIYDCANKQLCNIDHWLIANKLSLNVEKTNHVVFRTPNSKPPSNNLTLLIRNKRINRVTSSKFLGVILHKNLSWKPHMDTVLKRLRISLGVVRKISSYLNRSALTMLYHSMFNCHISYCVTTWCFGNKTVILNLQRSANKFIRLINGLNFRDSVKQVMVQSHLLSVEQTLEFEIACFMKRYNKSLLPPCFDDFFQTNSINSSAKNITRSTRSSSNLLPKFCRINVTKQSMKYKGPLIWNKIPLDIKRLKSYRNFRKHIRSHIISLNQK